jgi:hypothetical protein
MMEGKTHDNTARRSRLPTQGGGSGKSRRVSGTGTGENTVSCLRGEKNRKDEQPSWMASAGD